MKKIIIAFVALFSCVSVFAAYSVKSPDGKLEAKIDTDGSLKFSLYADGKKLLEDVAIGMTTDRGEFGNGAKVVSVRNSSSDGVLTPVYGINSKIRDRYNQTEIDFKTFKLLFRAYDEAVAYRFVSNAGKGQMKVFSEKLDLNLPQNRWLWASFARSDMNCYEEIYSPVTVAKAKGEHAVFLPLLINTPTAKVALVESDLQAYPMLQLRHDDSAGLKAHFVAYPKEMKRRNNFMIGYKSFENFIAKTDASREFPWRAFIVARDDRDLAVNDTVYKLAAPSKIADTSWISTGTCVWEWWSDWTLENVDFETGVNDKTYRAYIDFAAENSIPFIMFDAGWLVGRDVGGMPVDVHERIKDGKPFLDVKSLIEYAHSRDVKVILWCLGQSLNLYGEEAVPLMKSWGADGLKVDFFERDDQTAMELYYRIAKICADNKMLLDLHGCAKPAGLQRTYPNVVNFEAVRGLEMNKFFKPNGKKHSVPVYSDHDVNIVMTRMLQGPMDYTPGAMTNVRQKYYAPNFSMPASATTRAHQGALFVLYYAPLQMLCDSPSRYAKAPDFTSFIASVPTNWDESKAICGKMGEYVVVARRKGDVWYLGGIANQNGKDVEIDLSKFLPEGDYAAEILSDTVNSGKTPQDYKMSVRSVSSAEKLKFSMKESGGFAVRFTPEKFPAFSNFIRMIFGE